MEAELQFHKYELLKKNPKIYKMIKSKRQEFDLWKPSHRTTDPAWNILREPTGCSRFLSSWKVFYSMKRNITSLTKRIKLFTEPNCFCWAPPKRNRTSKNLRHFSSRQNVTSLYIICYKLIWHFNFSLATLQVTFANQVYTCTSD